MHGPIFYSQALLTNILVKTDQNPRNIKLHVSPRLSFLVKDPPFTRLRSNIQNIHLNSTIHDSIH